jgi:hypothetical protein
MAPVNWEEAFRHKRARGRLWPRAWPRRHLPPHPPTWDQAFGVLLGPLGFLALAAMIPHVGSAQLVGLAYVGAGLAGVAVSALDGLRSDWRARMIWALGALILGSALLVDGQGGMVSRAVQAAALALQAFAALIVLGSLKRRVVLVHIVAACSAAAPTVLIVAVLSQSPSMSGWMLGALHALSLIAFGLTRVARRPRGLRTVARDE